MKEDLRDELISLPVQIAQKTNGHLPSIGDTHHKIVALYYQIITEYVVYVLSKIFIAVFTDFVSYEPARATNACRNNMLF